MQLVKLTGPVSSWQTDYAGGETSGPGPWVPEQRVSGPACLDQISSVSLHVVVRQHDTARCRHAGKTAAPLPDTATRSSRAMAVRMSDGDKGAAVCESEQHNDVRQYVQDVSHRQCGCW